jgi:hypothetical protein
LNESIKTGFFFFLIFNFLICIIEKQVNATMSCLRMCNLETNRNNSLTSWGCHEVSYYKWRSHNLSSGVQTNKIILDFLLSAN